MLLPGSTFTAQNRAANLGELPTLSGLGAIFAEWSSCLSTEAQLAVIVYAITLTLLT